MTQASCHGAQSLHDPVPTRPQLVLAGNPNVGKTTLFNALTGSSAKVSNHMVRLIRARPRSTPIASSNIFRVASLRSPAERAFVTGTRSVIRFSSKVM